MKRYLPVVLILVVLVISIGGALLLSRNTQRASKAADAKANGAVPPEETGVHYLGGEHPAVALEEFGDYQCPPCGVLHPILKRIEADYGARLRFSFRNFPLPMHPHAAEAARAAEAAGLQGKFWEMHDLIYDKQLEWKDATDVRPVFVNYARALGLDVDRFNQDIDGTRGSMRVVLDQRDGQALGVKGTPTLFLNGKEVPFEDTMQYDRLRAKIEEALAGKPS